MTLGYHENVLQMQCFGFLKASKKFFERHFKKHSMALVKFICMCMHARMTYAELELITRSRSKPAVA
jgi:hypothetical protein